MDSKNSGRKEQRKKPLSCEFSASLLSAASSHNLGPRTTPVPLSLLIPRFIPKGRKEASQLLTSPTPCPQILPPFPHGRLPLSPHLPHLQPSCLAALASWAPVLYRVQKGTLSSDWNPRGSERQPVVCGWGNARLGLPATWERTSSRGFGCPRNWRLKRSSSYNPPDILLNSFHRWPFLIFLLHPLVRIIIFLTVLSWPLHLCYWCFMTVFLVRCTFPTKNQARVPKPCRVAPVSLLLT